MTRGRLNLSLERARRLTRAWGFEATLRDEVNSDYTNTPMCAHISPRLAWLGESSQAYRSTLARTSAYATLYTPRFTDSTACNIQVGGGVVAGILKKPNSSTKSTSLAAWDFGNIEDRPPRTGKKLVEILN